MIQTRIEPASLDRGRARRRWLPVWAACALLGLAGALLGPSCGGEELRCWSDERCEPCPGRCLEPGEWDAVPGVHEHIVWVGEQGEEPTCEEYGLEHEGDRWLDLQDDPSCPPCRCERNDCADGSVRFRSNGSDCETTENYGARTMHRPWDACEPLEDDGTSTSVTIPWYDTLRACDSREDLFQPGATWKRKARLCRAIQPREYSCGRYPNKPTCLVDTRVLSDDFRLCVSNAVPASGPDGGILEHPCPSEFPERLDMYRLVSGCGTCDCGFDGEPCSMEFSFYRDQACSDLVLTETLATEGVCIDLEEPVTFAGVKLRMLAEGHGDCIDRGRVGIVEGEKVKPTWGDTFCCKPAGG
ncbi:hypothetical protein BE11_15000 [Sorangium cellulosum]|nr:hypothetical protein BE11_15000 [Sorangium cellulosum]